MTAPRVVLVGGGRIADMHGRAHLELDRNSLYGLCDVDPGVCARRRAEWGLERTWTDFSAVLADPRVDAVEILTPHHLHLSMVTAAARAGKHVSVQKPMGLDLTECDAMIAACREAGVLFKVFENFVPPLSACPCADRGRAHRHAARHPNPHRRRLRRLTDSPALVGLAARRTP